MLGSKASGACAATRAAHEERVPAVVELLDAVDFLLTFRANFSKTPKKETPKHQTCTVGTVTLTNSL
eukprot:5109665-Amphidinium_carterae.1